GFSVEAPVASRDNRPLPNLCRWYSIRPTTVGGYCRVDFSDLFELPIPESLRLHALQVRPGVAELRPDFFFVAEEALFFLAGTDVQKIARIVSAEDFLKEVGCVEGPATLFKIG